MKNLAYFDTVSEFIVGEKIQSGSPALAMR